MSWILTPYRLVSLVLLGLLLSVALGSSLQGVARAEQRLDLCQLIGKLIPPPDPGHDPRRPGTAINRIITQVDQALGELWLANTDGDGAWNPCGSLPSITSVNECSLRGSRYTLDIC